jgi:two-component system sensor histidine kinase BaeS
MANGSSRLLQRHWRPTLFAKVFLALLLNALLLLLLMGLGVRWQVKQEFHRFLRQQESGRLSYLKQELETAYARRGAWEFLRDNPREWHDFLQRALRTAILQGERPPRAPRKEPRLRFPKAGLPPMSWARGLVLRDASGAVVIGKSTRQRRPMLELPILQAGRVVGRLEWYTTTRPATLRFLERNLELLWWLGGGLLAFSTLVAWGFSRYLLRPMHALQAGTQALQQRQFEHRIRVTSRDELGALAVAFNQMAAHLQEFEQQRQQWLSDTAHELRTPLAIMQGEIEAMQDGVRALDAEQLRSLHEEVSHLQRIVEDLRLINHLEIGRLSLERQPTDLAEVLRSTQMMIQPRMQEAGILWQANSANWPTCFVHVDVQRLRQVLFNLLDNILHYAPQSTVQLQMFCQPHSAAIILEDTGPGVPTEALPRLFDRFYRVDASRNRQRGGTGLGLAICRELIERHGGTIRAEAVTPHGLRLRIELPRATAESLEKEV